VHTTFYYQHTYICGDEPNRSLVHRCGTLFLFLPPLSHAAQVAAMLWILASSPLPPEY